MRLLKKMVEIIIGTILDNNLLKEGVKYSPLWDDDLTIEEVDITMYGGSRPTEGLNVMVRRFLKSSNLLPLGKMIHKILFNIMLPQIGYFNHVFKKDKFVLLKGKKINLVALILEQWMIAFEDHFT